MKDRIKSVDVLRGFAIIFMIPFHFHKFWTKQNFIYLTDLIIVLGNVAAPFFLIVSGISFFFYVYKKKMIELPKLTIFCDISKRALFIFIVSALIQIFFGFTINYSILFIIYWNLFQIIGFSMIIFFIIPFFKRIIRILICSALIFMISLINHIILFYSIDFLKFLVEYGSFPIIPWLNFYILGILIGDLIKFSFNEKEKISVFIFLLLGLTLITLWILWARFITYLWLSTFFISIGLFFILLALIYYYSDYRNLENIWQDTLIRWGRLSFSIYYIHFGVIVLGLIIFPVIIQDIYSNGFTIFQFLMFLIIFFISLELFIRIWKRFNYVLGFEWIMSKFTQKSLINEKKITN